MGWLPLFILIYCFVIHSMSVPGKLLNKPFKKEALKKKKINCKVIKNLETQSGKLRFCHIIL